MSQTGYSAVVIPGSQTLSKEAASELVYSSWLNTHIMWEKFRTTGGCYGAWAGIDSGERLFKLSTYRDPDPEKHSDLLPASLEEAAKTSLTHEDVEKAIVSCYGDAITPLTPRDRGKQAFETFVYANNGFKQLRVDRILEVQDEDVAQAAQRLVQMAAKESHKAIFCDKSKESYGKNLDIPL